VHALSLLKAEVDRDLALLGCPSIGELNPDFLETRDLFDDRLPGNALEKLRPVAAAANSRS
jgi:hypothetical protein